MPWKIDWVAVDADVEGGHNDPDLDCDFVWQSDTRSWYDANGLQGELSVSVHVSYECCVKGSYYYGEDCWTLSLSSGAYVSIGVESVRVYPGSCFEYQSCGSEAAFRVVFDRPMRMTWSSCCSGNDCCYSGGCPIDGSSCGSGAAEFPGAGVYVYDGYYGHYVYAKTTNYSFYFSGGAGSWSWADGIRFERMYPADVLPDGLVNGFDIAAILSKWGGPCDPQRTAEDVNLDGQVGAEDLAAVLFAWGTPG